MGGSFLQFSDPQQVLSDSYFILTFSIKTSNIKKNVKDLNFIIINSTSLIIPIKIIITHHDFHKTDK